MKNKKITKRLLSKNEKPALRSTKMRTMNVYELNTDLGTSVATVTTTYDDILNSNSGSTGALNYLSGQGWNFDNKFRKINLGGIYIGYISDKTVNINGYSTPFPSETRCDDVKKYHPQLLCNDGANGYYIVKSGKDFVTTDEWIFANALVTFSQVENYLGVTFDQNIRKNLPLVLS
jgi:hypothetical protein